MSKGPVTQQELKQVLHLFQTTELTIPQIVSSVGRSATVQFKKYLRSQLGEEYVNSESKRRGQALAHQNYQGCPERRARAAQKRRDWFNTEEGLAWRQENAQRSRERVKNNPDIAAHLQTPEARAKKAAAMKSKVYTPEERAAASKRNAERIAKQGIKRPNFMTGSYKSVKTHQLETFDSSFELVKMLELDAEPTVKTWTKRHGIVIELPGGRHYVPDFLIVTENETILCEVKMPRRALWRKMSAEDIEIKSAAAEVFCRSKGWRYVLEDHQRTYKPCDWPKSEERIQLHDDLLEALPQTPDTAMTIEEIALKVGMHPGTVTRKLRKAGHIISSEIRGWTQGQRGKNHYWRYTDGTPNYSQILDLGRKAK